MAYILNTDKGFYHNNCFFHNINEDEICLYSSYDTAKEVGEYLVSNKEIKSFHIEKIAINIEKKELDLGCIDEISTETFIVSTEIVKSFSLENHARKRELGMLGFVYEFKNKQDFINQISATKNKKEEFIKFLTDSIYSREIFLISVSYYNSHKYNYDEDCGLYELKNNTGYVVIT